MKQPICYERIPFDNTALPIRVNHSMRLTAAHSASKPQVSWHEQIEFLYFRKGGATIYCGNKSFRAVAGDVVIINPYEAHIISYYKEEAVYDCIMIDSALYKVPDISQEANRYFELLNDNHVFFETVISDDRELTNHIEAICWETENQEPMHELAVRSHVFNMMINLFRYHVYSGSAFRQLVENVERYDRIKPALQIMKNQLGEHLTLDKLANACHLSASHFCRLFRQITGQSPVQYLLEIRLQEATTLLKRTNKSITEIAYKVGFDNVGYFSRKFKEIYGISPSQAKTEYIDQPSKKGSV